MIGIPYAHESMDKQGRIWATCPECGLRIELVEAKDWESYSGIEYATHYKELHDDEATDPA